MFPQFQPEGEKEMIETFSEPVKLICPSKVWHDGHRQTFMFVCADNKMTFVTCFSRSIRTSTPNPGINHLQRRWSNSPWTRWCSHLCLLCLVICSLTDGARWKSLTVCERLPPHGDWLINGWSVWSIHRLSVDFCYLKEKRRSWG